MGRDFVGNLVALQNVLERGHSPTVVLGGSHELEDLGDEHENPCFRSNKDSGVTWIVVDFIDLVAHLFEPNQRAYYDLENLWSDAPRIEWRREDDQGR